MWSKKTQAPETKQTTFGEFVRQREGWEGYVEVGDTEAYVFVRDVRGYPNPRTLGFIPFINTHLLVLEQTARESIARISSEHYFDSIGEPLEEADFTLGFSWEKENWSETIYVDFKDGKIVGWCAVD